MLGADDAFDVFGVHGVGGIVGAILTGVFASQNLGGTGGLTPDTFAMGAQVWIQVKSVLITAVWSALRELWPKERANPGYLRRANFRVIDNGDGTSGSSNRRKRALWAGSSSFPQRFRGLPARYAGPGRLRPVRPAGEPRLRSSGKTGSAGNAAACDQPGMAGTADQGNRRRRQDDPRADGRQRGGGNRRCTGRPLQIRTAPSVSATIPIAGTGCSPTRSRHVPRRRPRRSALTQQRERKLCARPAP